MGTVSQESRYRKGTAITKNSRGKPFLSFMNSYLNAIDISPGIGRYIVHPFYGNIKLLQAVSHSKHSLTATAEF